MPVTIGLPFYNAENYLLDAVRSVFAQTYTDWELILIDDGSTDNSLDIAKSIKDPRVQVYSDGKNKKLAYRLNQIVELAKYEYIARMDADDLMSPTRIEEQVNILNNNPNFDLVSTGVISIKNNLEIIGVRGIDYENVTLKDLLHKRIGVVHAAILGKKSWFERNKYNTKLKVAQDYDLWLRAAANNDFNIKLIKKPLYYYREEGNTTYEKLKNAYINERKMYLKYAGKDKYQLILKSYLKSNIIYILNLINKLNILLEKRSTDTINKELLENYKNNIRIIKNTPVN
jgi:glycosyltransferase involved in cell wall biosynthesis